MNISTESSRNKAQSQASHRLTSSYRERFFNLWKDLSDMWAHLPKSAYLTLYFIMSLAAWRLTNKAAAFVAVWVGPALFGDFSVALRVSHNLAHLFVMGQEAILLMFLAKYNDNVEKQSGLIRWIIHSSVTKTLILFSIIFIVLYSDSTYLFSKIQRYYWFGFLSIPFVVGCGIYERFFLFLKSFFISFLPRGIYQPILCMLFIYLAQAYVEPSPTNALLCYAASFLIALLISVIYGYFSGFKLSTKFDDKDKSQWQVSGLYYTFSTLIIKSSPSFSIFFLERFGTVEASVGLFAAITYLTYGFHLLTKPFDSYLKPSIATLYSKQDISGLQNEVNTINKMRWCIIAALFMTLVVFGEQLLLDYGQSYTSGYLPLVTLAFFMLLQYLGQTSHELLNYTGNQQYLSYIMAGQCAIIVVLAGLCIPTYGIWGAVLAQGLPCVLATFASAYTLRKKTNIKAYLYF